ncbi:MAG: M20/M25/M40 family metallo-hydrolase [Anaerolineaceae bacterium]|nr:M20/M25/M40 family metallo-hydrolase [Anaerolineaceae bacterium]HNX46292.1 M20/M25/M40 family metallo-hydrolase [Anaerolineaceae bacterium]
MDPLTLILIGLGVLILALVAILLFRTNAYPITLDQPDVIELDIVDGQSVAERIGLAVQLRTVSNSDPEKINPIPFEGMRNLVSTLYPEIEQHLHRELVNGHALLYTWRGTDDTLDPVAFTAHQDVVPADEQDGAGWTHPPFSGVVADGYVWGRGTLDCKGTLVCLLEAVDRLLRLGFAPKRTVYLGFGHDEEVSGANGAKEIARALTQRGVKLSFLLDEGGSVVQGSVPGVDVPVGLIGVSEKGHMDLKLKAKVAGGHASTPGETTAIGALSLAIATLENNPFPQDLEMAQFMMSFLGDELPFTQRLALANTWLFGGAVKKRFAAKAASNALTRTTVAPTVIHAGSAVNVLPAEAEALLNIRILPGETSRNVFQRVTDLVGDEALQVLPAHASTLVEDTHVWEPSPISNVDSPQFELLANLVLAAFPGAKVAPFMMNGATDARYYTGICDNVYRFSPFFLSEEDVKTVHGVNERLSIENAGRAVAFYQELIAQVSALPAHANAEVEEEIVEDSAVEEVAIRRMRESLPTRPLKTTEPPVDVETLEAEPFEPLPDDDTPLEVKPLPKD